MLSISKLCDDCIPPYANARLKFRSLLTFSSIPFVLTFIAVAIFSWKKLFPLLSGRNNHVRHDAYPGSPRHTSFSSVRLHRPSVSIASWTKFCSDRAAAIAFSITIALSTVLAELIFCQVLNIVDPAARGVALEYTILALVVLLVLVTPAIEVHSITSATSFFGSGALGTTIQLLFDVIGFGAWLGLFWGVGNAVLGEAHATKPKDGISKGSLERIGIIGISLMASLAGFAAVSSLWQTFGVRARMVTETDITRKQAGLDATTEMLATKENRLHALEQKMSGAPTESLFTRLTGAFRGDSDAHELTALRMEVEGLSTMQATLSNSLTLLRARRTSQQQASTAYGRVCISASYLFALYCLYRIGATTSATLRRWWSPNTSFATTDPINNVLALVARHWDPSIDRAAWARQISFLLAGGMLLASFNAVLQTAVLFSRFTPARLMQSAQQNFALLVSQISATYVVSSALLLRSTLPQEMGSSIEGALGGAPLDPGFVERWFEGWFLAACALTAAGIWLGRKVVSGGEFADDYLMDDVDVESGKKS